MLLRQWRTRWMKTAFAYVHAQSRAGAKATGCCAESVKKTDKLGRSSACFSKRCAAFRRYSVSEGPSVTQLEFTWEISAEPVYFPGQRSFYEQHRQQKRTEH